MYMFIYAFVGDFTTKTVFLMKRQNHQNTRFDLGRLRQKYFIKNLIGVLSLFVLIFGAKNVTIHVNTRLEMVIIIIINEGKRKKLISAASQKKWPGLDVIFFFMLISTDYEIYPAHKCQKCQQLLAF